MYSFAVQDQDIAVAKAVGEALIESVQHFEEKMFNRQSICVDEVKSTAVSSEYSDGMKAMEDEGNAYATIIISHYIFNLSTHSAANNALANLSEEEKAEQGAMIEACKRASAWTQPLLNLKTLSVLQDHTLPAPQVVNKLFFALFCFLGGNPNLLKTAGGDLSWEKVKEVSDWNRYKCKFLIVIVCLYSMR